MIDNEQTQLEFGYDIKSIPDQSHKKIIAKCDDCGICRSVPRYAYRSLCNACARKVCNLSPDTIEKKKNSVLGDKNPFFGRKHTKEAKDKIANAILNQPLKLGIGVAAKNKVIAYYKRGAKNRDLIFSLSEKDIDELFCGNCHYCNATPGCIHKHGIANGVFVYNGIDRKDNSIGYIKDNCVSCCTLCNMTKRDLSYNDFILLVEKIYNNVKNKTR